MWTQSNKTEWTILQRKKGYKGWGHGTWMWTAIYTAVGKRTDFLRARVTTEKQWQREMWSICSEVKMTAVKWSAKCVCQGASNPPRKKRTYTYTQNPASQPIFVFLSIFCWFEFLFVCFFFLFQTFAAGGKKKLETKLLTFSENHQKSPQHPKPSKPFILVIGIPTHSTKHLLDQLRGVWYAQKWGEQKRAFLSLKSSQPATSVFVVDFFDAPCVCVFVFNVIDIV